LHTNIVEADYFKALVQLQTCNDIIDEIKIRVNHVEPWSPGTARLPSSAFCLLVYLLTIRLTRLELDGMLSCEDNNYVRALGFLYLRYTGIPKDLWKWYEPYLEDDETFSPGSNGQKITIGEYCIKLLTDMAYYGTTLPRIPIPIERKIKVMLLLLEEKKKRRRNNLRIKDEFYPGAKIKAIWGDDDNEPMWYTAVIDSIDRDNENRYWVTFPEYGNSECVDLGDMDVYNEKKSDDGRGNKGKERDHSRSRSRDRNRDDNRDRDLMAKVLQSSRDASAAIGKDYAKRPATYKGSLALKVDRFTGRKKSRSRSPVRKEWERDRNRDRDRDRNRSKSRSRSKSPDNNNNNNNNSNMKDQVEKLKKLQALKELYGDASAK